MRCERGCESSHRSGFDTDTRAYTILPRREGWNLGKDQAYRLYNAEVLQAMEHNPDQLLERLRIASEAAISRGSLAISDARRLMAHLRASLAQTTYLEG
mgnify:CR=1 FL=1